MRAHLGVCLLLSVLLGGACGGRVGENGSHEGGGADASGGSFSDGATSSGATNPRGGRSGSGGTVAVAGGFATGGVAFGGGFSIAGATSSGGGGCQCSRIDCPADTIPVINGDGCCFHCELACGNVLCPAIACGSGSHTEVLPGQCCPTCVQDSCEMQRAGYQALRRTLTEQYSTLPCMTNSDCVVYYEKNECSVGCGIVVHSSAIPYLDSRLQSYAQMYCAAPGCMFPTPPCDAPAAPICFGGRCE